MCLFLVVTFIKHLPAGLSQDANLFSSSPRSLLGMQALSSSVSYSLLLVSQPHRLAKSASEVTALAFNGSGTWLAAACSGVAGVQCLAVQPYSNIPVMQNWPCPSRRPPHLSETPERGRHGGIQEIQQAFFRRDASTSPHTRTHTGPDLSPEPTCRTEDCANALRGGNAQVQVSLGVLRREGLPTNCHSLLIPGGSTSPCDGGLHFDTPRGSRLYSVGGGCCGLREETHLGGALSRISSEVFPLSLSLQVRIHPPSASVVRTLKFSHTAESNMINQQGCKPEEQADDQEEVSPRRPLSARVSSEYTLGKTRKCVKYVTIR